MKQQQQSFFHLLLLVLLVIYCFCGSIATAIPISEGEGDDGAGLSLFAAAKGEGEDAIQTVPRGGGRREEQGGVLHSVMVVGERDNNNNWTGLDGNGNRNEGFLALNNNSPVLGGDGSGTVVGKGGDGQMLELASLSSSFRGADFSVPSPSSVNTPVKQQQQPSDIDPSTFSSNSKEEIASNPSNESRASLAAWEARLNAREQQQNLREQKQEAMANTLGGLRDTLIKQAEAFKKLLDERIAEDALPLGCTCRELTPEFPRGGI